MRLNRVMQLFTLFVAFLVSARSQLSSQSTGETVLAAAATLPAGTVVRLRTTKGIDSRHAKVGDSLPLEVMRDVKVGELLVIAKHTPVAATLTQVRRAPRGLRRGSLTLQVKTINDINGNSIDVSATRSETGPGERQVEAYTEVVLSMGFLAPPLFFIHGDEAVLPKGTEVDPMVSQDVALNVGALRERSATLEAEKAAIEQQSRSGQTTVHFYLHYPLAVGKWRTNSRHLENLVVLFDGRKLVRIRAWNFYDAYIAPGHHVVGCCGNQLELDTRANEQYYISIAQEHGWAGLTGHWVLRLADRESGEEQIYPRIPAGKKDVYPGAH